MKFSKVTTNGRVTIPASIRNKYRLYSGRKVKFEIENDRIRNIPLFTKENIKENIGILGTNGKMLKYLMKEKRIERKK